MVLYGSQPQIKAMTTTPNTVNQLLSGSIEILVGHLATAEAKAAESKAEVSRLRGEIQGLMEQGGMARTRTVWGLVSLTEGRTTWGDYPAAVEALRVRLKAAEQTAQIKGKATKKAGKPGIRVAWAK